MKANAKHNPWVFNGVVWFLSFIILSFVFFEGSPRRIDFLYSFSFLLTLIPPVLINVYILIPKFLVKGKYILFGFVFFVNLILFSYANDLFFSEFIDFVFPSYYFISYHSIYQLVLIFGIFLVSTMLLKLSENWFFLSKQEQKILELENQKVQTELALLHSQINPHFLFNALNVVYNMALEKSSQTTVAILQLSDILRYVIYDTKVPKVQLSQELRLLDNYISFQKNRYTSENIKFYYYFDSEGYMLVPMLFLPLVENAFKHGLRGSGENGFIDLRIEVEKGVLFLSCTNNYQKKEMEEESSGIGIANVKKNLELLYQGRYSLEIVQIDNEYSVNLKIVLDE